MFQSIRSLFGSIAESRARQKRRASALPKRYANLGVERLEERAMMAYGDFNDQMTEADILNTFEVDQPSAVARGKIESGGDVQMYRFLVQKAAPGGELITIDVDHVGAPTLNTFLRVFDSKGNEIDWNDNRAAPGETLGKEAFLARRYSPGAYYVGVSSNTNIRYHPKTGEGDNRQAAGTGDFIIGIRRKGDDHNDQIEEGGKSPFYLGKTTEVLSTTESIRIGGDYAEPGDYTDVDMYGFIVEAGQRISFDTDNAEGGGRSANALLATRLRIFDSNGKQLNLDAGINKGAPGELQKGTKEAYLEHTFATAGPYYVGVSAAFNSKYDAVTGSGDPRLTPGAKLPPEWAIQGGYRLTLTPMNTDWNDQIKEAPKADWYNSGSLGTLDVNMYKYTVTEPAKFHLGVYVPTDSKQRVHLRLFDGNGNQIASGSAGDPSQGFDKWNGYRSVPFVEQVTLKNLTVPAGTYYVGLSIEGNNTYDAVTGNGDTHVPGGGLEYELRGGFLSTRPAPPPTFV